MQRKWERAMTWIVEDGATIAARMLCLSESANQQPRSSLSSYHTLCASKGLWTPWLKKQIIYVQSLVITTVFVTKEFAVKSNLLL